MACAWTLSAWTLSKRLQPQDHIRMQQISCDTALMRTMGYIGSVVPFACPRGLQPSGLRHYWANIIMPCGTRACVTTITCGPTSKTFRWINFTLYGLSIHIASAVSYMFVEQFSWGLLNPRKQAPRNIRFIQWRMYRKGGSRGWRPPYF